MSLFRENRPLRVLRVTGSSFDRKFERNDIKVLNEVSGNSIDGIWKIFIQYSFLY